MALKLTITLIWDLLLLLSSHKQWFDDCGTCLESSSYFIRLFGRTFTVLTAVKVALTTHFIATTYYEWLNALLLQNVT